MRNVSGFFLITLVAIASGLLSACNPLVQKSSVDSTFLKATPVPDVKSVDQVDDTSGEFTSGTFSGANYGTLTDGLNSGVKIANNGGCDGTSTNCAELDSSWTPKWSNIDHYWKLNNNYTDSVGTSNGTPNGIPILTANYKMGSHGLSCNNTSGRMNASLSNSMPYDLHNFSVAFWFRATDTSVQWSSLLGTWSGAGNHSSFSVGFDAGNIGGTTTNRLYFQFYDTLYYGLYSTSNVIATGQWYHAVVVRTGNSAGTIYLNGEPAAQFTNMSGAAGHLAPDATVFTLCGRGGGMATAGDIDDVAMWNTNLSAVDVKTIYDRQSAARSGQFTSRVMNAQANNAMWTTLSWLPVLPFMKELQSASESVASYSSLANSTLTNGLKALWHFNETAATVGANNDFVDSSGNGNHAEASGTVTFAGYGKLDKAISLAGTGSAIVPTSSSLDITGSYTLQSWVKIVDATSYGFMISKTQDGNGTQGYELFYNPGGFMRCSMSNAVSSVADPNFDITTPLSYADGNWHHVACVYDKGTKAYLFVDGVLVKTSTNNPSAAVLTTSTSLYLGKRGSGFGAVIGSMDEAAIWSRALSATEIQQLYQRGAARLKFQVRSCALSDCSDGSWIGPDGTSATYYGELNNPSALTSPNIQFITSPANNRYFQYRSFLESDSTNSALYPEFKTVTVDPIHWY